MKIITLLLASMLPMTADARIGETQEQCIKRYGIPIKIVNEANLVFKAKGLLISVILGPDRKCMSINYTDQGKQKKILSKEVVAELTKVNTGPQKWKEIKSDGVELHMESANLKWSLVITFADGTAQAISLMILDLKQAVEVEKSRKKSERKKIEGL